MYITFLSHYMYIDIWVMRAYLFAQYIAAIFNLYFSLFGDDLATPWYTVVCPSSL